ncbi:MAG: HAMP domain-containing sensor histidine kinase [Planctomycetota bacterium]
MHETLTSSDNPPVMREVSAADRVDELGRIILAYSEITERLEASQDQLRQRVERLQAELGEKNRQLEQRNRLAALGEMAAGMAHELRNPLGGITLYTDLLGAEVVEQPSASAFVGKIGQAVRRLERIVDRTLRFAGNVTARRQVCDVVPIVREAVDLAGGATIDAPPSLVADVDPDLLCQAVLNLVRNANEVADAVRVSVSDGLEITVRDNGPGFPAEMLDRAFEPFVTTKLDGTGLGLAIVARIAEAHDGTSTARNDNGAIVTIELPSESTG